MGLNRTHIAVHRHHPLLYLNGKLFAPLLERVITTDKFADVFRNIGNRKCFFGKYDNFFVVELPEGVPADSEYWVFFFVERADKHEAHALNLIVQSAYVGKRERSPVGRLGKKSYLQSPRLKGIGWWKTKTAALKKQTPPVAGFVCRSS